MDPNFRDLLETVNFIKEQWPERTRYRLMQLFPAFGMHSAQRPARRQASARLNVHEAGNTVSGR
jgi:hypothetical protein